MLRPLMMLLLIAAATLAQSSYTITDQNSVDVTNATEVEPGDVLTVNVVLAEGHTLTRLDMTLLTPTGKRLDWLDPTSVTTSKPVVQLCWLQVVVEIRDASGNVVVAGDHLYFCDYDDPQPASVVLPPNQTPNKDGSPGATPPVVGPPLPPPPIPFSGQTTDPNSTPPDLVIQNQILPYAGFNMTPVAPHNQPPCSNATCSISSASHGMDFSGIVDTSWLHIPTGEGTTWEHEVRYDWWRNEDSPPTADTLNSQVVGTTSIAPEEVLFVVPEPDPGTTGYLNIILRVTEMIDPDGPGGNPPYPMQYVYPWQIALCG